MDKVFGKTGGLKASQHERLQHLYDRRVPPAEIISPELTRQLAAISREIERQVALLINRKGEVRYVIVGARDRFSIPDLSRLRTGPGRLNGLRCVHTQLGREAFSEQDMSRLVLGGLDLLAGISVDEKGIAGSIRFAHILPDNRGGKGYALHSVRDTGQLKVDFLELVRSLEEELGRNRRRPLKGNGERAILVGVTSGSPWSEEASMDELEELALSDDIEVMGRAVQHVKRPDPRFLIGRGKLTDLALRCLQTGANLLVFNNELTPAQVRSLTDSTDLKIVDRSQLILDIFARRAVTREGKIQVELAQLKYLLPRLATKNTAMSRLTGGIGGRGPGETKLEINRRRVRERIAGLHGELKKIRLQRAGRRHLRKKGGLPVISIVGYTNAGKSTLLNSLTRSRVSAGNRLFETLDPSSRRLRFPRETEAIITDTVGFIRDLPESLIEAFAATLEELHEADLLLHVVDASTPRLDEQAKTVEELLERLDLVRIRTLLVLNKTDLLPPEAAMNLAKKTGGVAISAIHPPTLAALTERIETLLWPRFSIPST